MMAAATAVPWTDPWLRHEVTAKPRYGGTAGDVLITRRGNLLHTSEFANWVLGQKHLTRKSFYHDHRHRQRRLHRHLLIQKVIHPPRLPNHVSRVAGHTAFHWPCRWDGYRGRSQWMHRWISLSSNFEKLF